MRPIPLLDRAGRRRSPVTTSPFRKGVMPGNQGLRYPLDPPTVEEIIAVMHAAGHELEAGQAARRDRRPMARRAADQRSARAQPNRPRS
jgi:hypothetical protein